MTIETPATWPFGSAEAGRSVHHTYRAWQPHRAYTAALIAVLVALGALLSFAPASALAAEGWGVTSTFGSPGTGNGQLKEPDGVAVNQTSGDVYVVDKGNNRVEYFSATGTFEHQFNGTEIDGSAAAKPAPAKFSEPQFIAIAPDGDVYVSDHGNGVIDKFTATGEYLSQLAARPSGVLGVAVDGAGNVWVYEENAEVSEYSEAGILEKHFNTGRGVAPGLAVDSEDTVYLVPGSRDVSKYDPATGLAKEEEFAGGVTALAIDLKTNEVYVDEGTTLVQYGPFGKPFSKPVHRAGAHLVASSAGVAVDSTSHAVYLADSTGDDVAILGLGSGPAAPTTEPVTAITTTTATFNGKLALSATQSTEYSFDYKIGEAGAECTGGSSTTPVNAGTGSGSKAVSTPVTKLEPNQSYAVCLVAENGFGSEAGPVEIAKTDPAPPTVFGGSTSAVTPYSARMEGLVNPNNELITTCKIEYGRTIAYGNRLPCEGAPEPFEGFNEGGDAVGANVAVLAADTTYHFRVVATNATGTSEDTGEFTTEALQESGVGGESAEEITPFGAKLQAQVNPNFQETTCEFEYGAEPLLATGVTTVACPTSLGTGGAPVSTSIVLTGLTPKTHYYYRVFATNGTGTKVGSIETFETATLEKPVVSITVATETTRTGAKVVALLSPEFQETTCKVKYIDEASFKATGYAGAAETPCEPEDIEASLGYSETIAGANLTGLEPNTTYHYKVLAKNASGLDESEGPTFLTLPNPPTVATGAASEVTPESATISGSVNPGAEGYPAQDKTNYYFQYSTDTSYDHQVPGAFDEAEAEACRIDQEKHEACPLENEAGEGKSNVANEVHLTGLEPDTTYHYRIVAVNDKSGAPQVAYSEAKTFTTVATPPALSEVSVSGVSQSGASIAATLAAQGLPTHWEVWLGNAQGSLDFATSGNTAGSGPEAIAASVGSLTPGTTYYYKLVATNPDGTAESAEASFTTAPAPLAVSVLTQPPTPLLTLPNVKFPPEAKVTTPKKTAKCPKGKHRSHGKCVKTAKKHKPAKNAGHAQGSK